MYDRVEENLGAPLQHMLTLLQVGYTTCQVNFSRNGQRYTYKVSDEVAKTLKAGDQVVVPATARSSDMGIATVVSVDDEPQIDVTAPYEYKWIVCRVNREAYDDQIKRETEAAALIKKNERKRAQQQALKVFFGDASLEAARAILSPKSREIPE